MIAVPTVPALQLPFVFRSFHIFYDAEKAPRTS